MQVVIIYCDTIITFKAKLHDFQICTTFVTNRREVKKKK